MTRQTVERPAEAQARRLERVHDEVARLLRSPGVATRLRTAPGAGEWSALQTLRIPRDVRHRAPPPAHDPAGFGLRRALTRLVPR